MDYNTENVKGSTKERIIQETFQLMSSMAYSNISLSQIAARVGISKTAIFRHFSNKEELLDVLEERFIDEVAACFPSEGISCRTAELLFTEECLYDTWKKLVVLLCIKPEYMCFFVRMLTSSIDFSSKIAEGLRKRGIPVAQYKIDDIQPLTCVSYIYTTMFFFLMKYWGFSKSGYEQLPAPEKFADILFSFLKNGWKLLEVIPSETIEQLNAWCSFSTEEKLPPLDRFFVAFAQALRKNGFPNVTVELIAAELGMAKSSLYEYFKNKDEMIRNLIEEEAVYIIEVVERKFSKMRTLSFSERIYCLFRITIEYLQLRPEILSVATWLCLRNEEFLSSIFKHIKEKEFICGGNAFRSFIFSDAGLPLEFPSILEWLVTVAVLQVVSGMHRHIDETEILGSVQFIYEILLKGVRTDEKSSRKYVDMCFNN